MSKNLVRTINEAEIRKSIEAKRIIELMKKNKLEELSEDFVPPATFRYAKNLYRYTGVKYKNFYQYEMVNHKDDKDAVCLAGFTTFEILEAIGFLSDTSENPNRNTSTTT